MSDEIKIVVKGAGISFIGSLFTLVFRFIGQRVLIARMVTRAEYGIYSLALVIVSICTLIATLGLTQGTARFVAYAKGKKDIERVRSSIVTSILLGISAGTTLCILIFLLSDIIANVVFHEPSLALPLRILTFAIPFTTLMYILDSVFRGFEDVRPGVYFGKILGSITTFTFIVSIMLLNLPFIYVFYAILASTILICLTFVVYAIKHLPVPVKFRIGFSRELLLFSLPLLGATILTQIFAWTDTLMLGMLRTPADVGLYNAANPLARFIIAPMLIMLTIYIPVTSRLYAQGSISEIRRNYSILTKWICLVTFPFFLLLFFYPEAVLEFVFGKNYAPAAGALRVLSLGFIISNFLGPSEGALIALGESRFVMWATLVAAILNIILNAALIPFFGIVGAATATMISEVNMSIIRWWKVHSLSKALPLSKNLIKPVLVSLTLITIFHLIINYAIAYWMALLLFLLCYVVYALAVIFTKCLDQEDIDMILTIEQLTGMNTKPIKKILKKFVKI